MAKNKKTTSEGKVQKIFSSPHSCKKDVASVKNLALFKSKESNLKQLKNYKEFIRYLLSDDVGCEISD